MIKSPLDSLDDDIRDHIERETQDNIDRGMSPVDARAAAIRKFGNIARIKEDTRAVWVPRIVISDGLWRRLFGADPSVVERTVWLNKVPTTVAGITGRGFDGLGPRPRDVILDMGAAAPWRRERQNVNLQSRSNAAHTRPRIDHIRAALNRAAADSSLQIGVAGAVPISSGRPGLQSSVQPAGSEARFRCRLLPLTEAGAAVLELRLRCGRWAWDDPHAAEAVMNETLARQIWQDGSIVGRSLTLSYDDRAYTIVGVVQDAHLTSLSEIEPIIHVTDTSSLPVLLARTSPGVEARSKALVAEIDPSIELTFFPLSRSVKESLENALIGVTIAGGLAVVALILAIIGVFGVFSYLVEERRQEIGIRLALGATRLQIGRALLTAVRGAMTGGLLAGLGLSAIAAVLLRRFLLGLSPADPISYLIVTIVLATAALAGTAIPVRRAVRLDPALTLKTE